MCGSASDRTRAMSWGETFIERALSNSRRSGTNVAAPFSEPPARTKEALLESASVRKSGRSSNRPTRRHRCGRDGPTGYWMPAVAGHDSEGICAANSIAMTLTRAALLEQPRDRRAQFGDAGVTVRRGQRYFGIGGGVAGERRLGGGHPGGEVGSLDLVGLGQHDLVVDRGLVQGREHGVVDRLEAMAGVDQKID